MSTLDDSQLARLVVERKLCTTNEVALVRTEMRERVQKGEKIRFPEILVEHGFITKSQVKRLGRAMDNDSMYRPAQQIPGYQVMNKVGQGAMAVVFKARQLSLDRLVAIKVLPKRLSENPEFVDRFYREGRAAGALNHPNIVQAFDVGESSGYHYFVMEFIDGQTVYDLLTPDNPMNEQEAIRIVTHVADALGHSHKQGLIHRDVKPKNIMITKEGAVKLADMGLAREVSDFATANAEAGRAYGTPYYISPEQIRGEINIDCRADIYALGATFYHMVAGRVPFEGTTPTEVMQKHLKEQLAPADHINHALSSGVGEIIEVMMAKNPDDRYPSTLELISDLQAVARGEAPLQARKRYDSVLLESLATSGEVIVDDHGANRKQASNQLPIILGVLLALSAVCNFVMLAILFSKH